MKKIHAILIVSLLTSSVAMAKDAYVFATHTKSPISDFLGDVLGAVFKDAGKKFELKALKGKEVLKGVNSGKYDGDTSRVGKFRKLAGKKGANYVKTDESSIQISLVMITKKDAGKLAGTWEAANAGGRAAFLRGSRKLNKKLIGRVKLPVNEVSEGLDKVVSGEASKMVVFKLMAQKALKAGGAKYKDLVIQEAAIESFPLFPYVHKSNADLKPIIEAGIKKLKASGKYQKMYDKYAK